MTDRRTDGGDCNIHDTFFKKSGDNEGAKEVTTLFVNF